MQSNRPENSIQTHMQRNAKSQAVTGEPGRAGSAPIAPAATTPQPTGESIANSAAIWRRGINVRLFECSIGASGAKEVVEGHFGLDDAGMLVAQEIIDGGIIPN